MPTKSSSPLLRWIVNMSSLYASEEIKIPSEYREQVISVIELLDSDISGTVNTVLDMAINAASVKYMVKTSNSNLTVRLNNWLDNINKDLRGKVPKGIKGLGKEYFKERWKGSSLLLLRTLWRRVDGWELPVKLWFVDGKDIKVKIKKPVVLGGEKYFLIVDPHTPDKDIELPNRKNEMIFVQKPYELWGSGYTVPFVIKRGIYKNLKFLELLETKSEKVVARALEYLFLMKKGDAALATNHIKDYGKDELIEAKNSLKKFMSERKTEDGLDAYVTNFDTDIQHLIPEYGNILKGELSSPILRRIFAGLGLVEIVVGTAGNRKENILNPKPLKSEVVGAVSDFGLLLEDVMDEVIERNKDKHQLNKDKIIKLHHDVIKDFLTEKELDYIKGGYDRGVISKEGFSNVIYVPGMDFDVELERRKDEKKKKIDEDMYPQITINREDTSHAPDFVNGPSSKEKEEKITEDKKGVDKRNFIKAHVTVKCPKCGTRFIYEAQEEVKEGFVKCPDCDELVGRDDLVTATVLEGAPYTLKDYPPQIKNLSSGARKIWINSFNAILRETNDEDSARKGAWRNVKLRYRKNSKGIWVLKNKSELAKSLKEVDISELIEIKKLEIMGKQEMVLDEFLKNNKEEKEEEKTND